MEFSHHVGIFPIIFLFLRPEFTLLVFKRNCSREDSNQRPFGQESSTLTPTPSPYAHSYSHNFFLANFSHFSQQFRNQRQIMRFLYSYSKFEKKKFVRPTNLEETQKIAIVLSVNFSEAWICTKCMQEISRETMH